MNRLLSQVHQTMAETIETKFDTIFREDVHKDFDEVPVDFRTFVESAEHMNFVPLSGRQYAVADFMLSGKDIFDNGNYMAVLEFGKGAGKDMLANLIILYAVYYCLCLKDPQAYFGLPSGEPIDCLNIAYSAKQAQDVFFTKLKQKVLGWNWLKNKHAVKTSGIYLNQIKKDSMGNVKEEVLVTRNGVLFPKLIRAFSGHSAEESLEGLNLLLFVLDEVSAFKDKTQTRNADKIYSMLRSSATSRFGTKWKGFLLSYPRYKNDFIEKMYETSKGELHWYGDKAATWEVKPPHLFSGRFFEFHGRLIPKEFEDEYRLDPTEAMSRYECTPPEAEYAFIEYPEKVDRCIDAGQEPFAIFLDYSENGEVRKKLLSFMGEFPSRPHVITIDLGLRNDACALSMFRKENRGGVDYVVQELGITWEPDKGAGLIVSFINVENVIAELKKHYNIVSVFFDQWNSASLCQRLNAMGIYSTEYRLGLQDYKNFKERLYLGTIRLLDIPDQTMEIKQLVMRKVKVDHPVDSSKDRVDTIVGAIKMLTGQGVPSSSYMGEGGMRIQENLQSQGGSFV